MRGSNRGGAGGALLGFFGIVLVLFVITKILPSLFKIILVGMFVLAGLFAAGVIIATVYAIKSGADENKKRMNPAASPAANSGDPDEIREAKTQILKINGSIRKISDDEVRGKAYEAYNWALKIVNELSRQPHEIKRTKHFFNYYLPTLETVLEKYLTVEAGGVTADAKEKTTACCDNLTDAYKKQYAGLFNDEILDLTVEKKTLDTMLTRDGIREE